MVKYKITARPNMNPWQNFTYHIGKNNIVFTHGVAYVTEKEYLECFKNEPMRFKIEEVE